jgi:AraC family transcriptional regulator
MSLPANTSPVTPPPPWSESAAWGSVAATAWRPLGGSFHGEGFSLEWHELEQNDRVDWSRSFHPRSVEVCLNVRGRASVAVGSRRLELADGTTGFYVRGDEPLTGSRAVGEPHQFLTLELSFDFLRAQLGDQKQGLHPLILKVVSGENRAGGVGTTSPITTRQEELLKSLREPPVQSVARGVWFRGKALELMSEILFEQDDGELFCTRQKRVARDRVEKVIQILRENMEEPPALEEIGRRVACSPYYLSRTFSQETGMTIPQYLRRIRMEKAAELLRTGRYNVTEVALEVGYNSLSHFSQAFCQTMGSCPAIFQAREGKKT